MTETFAVLCVLKQNVLSAAVGIVCFKFNFYHAFVTNFNMNQAVILYWYYLMYSHVKK